MGGWRTAIATWHDQRTIEAGNRHDRQDDRQVALMWMGISRGSSLPDSLRLMPTRLTSLSTLTPPFALPDVAYAGYAVHVGHNRRNSSSISRTSKAIEKEPKLEVTGLSYITACPLGALLVTHQLHPCPPLYPRSGGAPQKRPLGG